MGEDSTSNDEMGRYNVNNILRLKSAQSHHQVSVTQQVTKEDGQLELGNNLETISLYC